MPVVLGDALVLLQHRRHRVLRRLRVARRDRVGHRDVALAADPGAVVHQHADLVGDAQHRQDDLPHLAHHGVGGRVEDGEVELAVGREQRLNRGLARADRVGGGEDRLHLRRARPLGGEGGGGGLENHAQLGRLEEHAADARVVGLVPGDHVAVEQVPLVDLADARAVAPRGAHEPLAGQHLHRVAHRGAADAERGGELGLRRHHLARPVDAVGDPLPQRLDRLLGRAGGQRRGGSERQRQARRAGAVTRCIQTRLLLLYSPADPCHSRSHVEVRSITNVSRATTAPAASPLSTEGDEEETMRLVQALARAALATTMALAGPSALRAEEIKFGIGLPESDIPEYNALVRFKKYVEFKTNGEITVRLFPNNQLGGEREMIEQVQQGSLELTLPADGAMAGFYPKMQVWSIPYLFESAPIAWKVMTSAFADKMRADILKETGIRVLAFSENGFRSFTNNVRPIINPEDIAGLKIRTMESPVFMKLVNSLGATATPISGSEVLLSLRQGVVDGQENPPSVVYGGGMGEVQKYYTLNEHVLGLHLIIANNEWFEGLSPGNQQIIADAAALMAWTENLQKTEGDWKFSEKLESELGITLRRSSPQGLAGTNFMQQFEIAKS